jgi:hypothetical protein
MADESLGALVIWHDIAAGHEDFVNDWYNREHHAERLSIPGFRRVQRFIALDGTPKYYISYEVSDVMVLSSPAYMQYQNAPTEWSRKAMPQFRNNSRTVCKTVWQAGFGIGGVAGTYRFAPAEGGDDRLTAWLTGSALPGLMSHQGIVNCRYWCADQERTTIPSAMLGLRGAPDRVVDRIIMVSGNTTRTVEDVCMKYLFPDDFARRGAASRPEIGQYQLIFTATSNAV